jgi:PBP1b-binding outer membrane lipoprotein LpoB
MSIHTQIIIAAVILLAVLISGCQPTVTESVPGASASDNQANASDPQAPAAPPTLISTLIRPQGRWASTFDSNDLDAVQSYNLVVLKDALIQMSQRIRAIEAWIDPNSTPLTMEDTE